MVATFFEVRTARWPAFEPVSPAADATGIAGITAPSVRAVTVPFSVGDVAVTSTDR